MMKDRKLLAEDTAREGNGARWCRLRPSNLLMPRRAKGQPEFPNRVMVEEDLDSEREVMLSGSSGSV